MMKSQYDYSQRTNQELVAILKAQVSNERKAQAAYLACLAEMEGRMLYAELGYSSMFNYCVRELGFAEGSAGRRIRTASWRISLMRRWRSFWKRRIQGGE